MSREDTGNLFTYEVEKIIATNRVAKVVKGGRNFSFNAIVAVGDRNGNVGVGVGKANEIVDAIRKAKEKATRSVFSVPIVKGTIPHEIIGKFGASRILLKPASPGTGIIAGGTARAILEAAGIENILSKSLGSNTKGNVVKATINGLKSLRTISEAAAFRGKKVEEITGASLRKPIEELAENIELEDNDSDIFEIDEPVVETEDTSEVHLEVEEREETEELTDEED